MPAGSAIHDDPDHAVPARHIGEALLQAGRAVGGVDEDLVPARTEFVRAVDFSAPVSDDRI